MASGNFVAYGPTLAASLNGECDLGAGNLVVMYTSSAHTPNKDHAFQNQLTNVVSGGATGIPTGGVPVAGSAAYDAANDRVVFDVADAALDPVTATVRNAHIVDTTGGTAATNRLVAFITFDADLSPNNGALEIAIGDVYRIPV